MERPAQTFGGFRGGLAVTDAGLVLEGIAQGCRRLNYSPYALGSGAQGGDGTKRWRVESAPDGSFAGSLAYPIRFAGVHDGVLDYCLRP